MPSVFLRFLMTVTLACILPCAAGAQYYQYKNYTTADGLPSNTIYKIIQDRDGFIWFATDKGVARFDGKHFNVFTIDDGLADNEMLGIFEDSKDRIWFASLNGQFSFYQDGKIYNHENCSFLRHTQNAGYIIHIFEDEDHAIWFKNTNVRSYTKITADNKVEEVDLPANVILLFSHLDKTYTIKDFVVGSFNNSDEKYPIPYHADNSRAVGTYDYNDSAKILLFRNYIYYFDDKLVPVYLNEYKNNIDNIQTIYVDEKTGKILVASDNGARLIQPDSTGMYRTTERFLLDKKIKYCFRDNEDNYWFATDGEGLYFLRNNYNCNIVYNSETGLRSDAIHALETDSAGNIWIGDEAGYIYRLANEIITTYHSNYMVGNKLRIRDITFDGRGIWFASEASTVYSIISSGQDGPNEYQLETRPFSRGASKSICTDRDGTVWCATGKELFVVEKHRSPETTTLISVRTYAVGTYGEYVACASDSGMYVYRGLEVYKILDFLPLPVSKSVRGIKFYNDTTLILATNGYGVYITSFDHLLRVIKHSDGLSGNIVNDVFFEPPGKIWCATTAGITSFRVNKQFTPSEFKYYNTDNGLSNNDVHKIIIQKNHVLATTAKGFNILAYDEVLQQPPPGIYFMGIRLNDSIDLMNTAETVFGGKNNNIIFRFSGIHFSYPDGVEYAYKLSGITDSFTIIDDNYIKYYHLPAGKYTFYVKAKTAVSDWGDPIEYSFEIVIPFWKTSIAKYLIVTILIAISIIIYISSKNYRQKVAIEKNMLSLKINELENQALQAMMNPHFIYNALNSIQSFLFKNDTAKTNFYLTRFSRLIRLNMDSITKSFVTVDTEIERLNLYLSVEQLRLGDMLNYKIDVDPEIDQEEIYIPAMILQPFVENSIWHGLMPKNSPGDVIIRFEKKQQFIHCIIQDNGIGIIQNKKNERSLGKGISVAKQRLELLSQQFKKPFSLHIAGSKPGDVHQGTTVELIFPELIQSDLK